MRNHFVLAVASWHFVEVHALALKKLARARSRANGTGTRTLALGASRDPAWQAVALPAGIDCAPRHSHTAKCRAESGGWSVVTWQSHLLLKIAFVRIIFRAVNARRRSGATAPPWEQFHRERDMTTGSKANGRKRAASIAAAASDDGTRTGRLLAVSRHAETCPANFSTAERGFASSYDSALFALTGAGCGGPSGASEHHERDRADTDFCGASQDALHVGLRHDEPGPRGCRAGPLP